MTNKDLYVLLEEYFERFGDLPPMSAIKKEYGISDDKTILAAIKTLKRRQKLPKEFSLALDYGSV